MKIFKNLSIEIPGTNTHYFNLDEFNDDNSKDVIYYGYSFLENGFDKNLIKNYNRNVYLNVTMPTEFCSNQSINADDDFSEIWTICPYSVKWLNEIKKTNKYKTIFYPFNKKDIPQNSEKKYDVIYHGGLHGDVYIEILNQIKKFNYRYATQTHGINELTRGYLSYATNTNLSNKEKLNLISECKISICLNYFTVRNIQDSSNIKNKIDWQKNEAFKHIDDLKIIPQFKSRCNEAAFSKTLNLVHRDPWNIIENYYEKDEFVYFDNIEELPLVIKQILDSWDEYIPIIEKAYKKSLNYTTEKMYKLINNNIDKYGM
jgi:hypothetical protein